MWSNYHTHTSYCDGTHDPAEIIPYTTGLASVGFSSHAPLPFECKWCIKRDELTRYLGVIETLKPAVTAPEVYTGLEIDFIPGLITPAQFTGKTDYTIGSVHFVDAYTHGQPWEVDGSHAVFLEGLEQIFHNNIEDAIQRYFELVRQMVDTACPTIVGHLDKIKIQNVENRFFSETDTWYRKAVIRTLDCIAARGAIVEVNTRGLYQGKSSTPYPSPWVLELILQKNIPITISSDAHHPRDLTNHFEETASLLYHTGFRKLSILLGGEWQQHKFNARGFVF